MSEMVIQKHDCTPERRLGKWLIHLPTVLEDRLQKANGRAAGLLLPPPSGQARSRETRYTSNGEAVFATGTRQRPKNRSTATLLLVHGIPVARWSGRSPKPGHTLYPGVRELEVRPLPRAADWPSLRTAENFITLNARQDWLA